MLDQVIALLKDEELLEFIAEISYQYYLAQNTDSAYTASLHRGLQEVETSIANLLRAIEAGIFNSVTKQRMDELDIQKTELTTALAVSKLREDFGLKKEQILYFLQQFVKMDYTDLECQKRLIKIFVNAIFVYDDKIVLTFNYSEDKRTISLAEIEGGLEQPVRLPRAMFHHYVCAIWLSSTYRVVDSHFCYPKT